MCPRVQDRIELAKSGRDVVRIENGHLSRSHEPLGAHHPQIGPRNGQNPGTPPRRPGHRSDTPVDVSPAERPRLGTQRVRRQEGREVLPHGNRPDPRTAAAMRDAEGLVQIQVGDVGPELAGLGKSHEGIEVCPIEIHLTTGLVDRRADLPDRRLEHAMGGRVGDHQRGEDIAILVDLRSQVNDIDVALVIARHNDPAITAEAAFVPCALLGMRQTSRSGCPVLRW